MRMKESSKVVREITAKALSVMEEPLTPSMFSTRKEAESDLTQRYAVAMRFIMGAFLECETREALVYVRDRKYEVMDMFSESKETIERRWADE